jgi:Zn-dependent membrane protease YugP
MVGVNKTLNAAALTYVAAFVSSLSYLLYLLSMVAGNRD